MHINSRFIFLQSILLLMLAQLSTDIYLPSMPAMSTDWHVSTAHAKLTITSIIIALGLSQLYWGPLSDAIGRRKVCLWGLAIFVLGCFLLVLTDNIYIVMLARIIQGLGLGFGLSISSAVASDLYEGKKLYQAMSVISVIYWEYSLFTFIAPMVLFMFGSGLAFPNAIGLCISVFPEKAGAASSLAVGGLTVFGGMLTGIIAKIPADVDYALPSFVAVMVILMMVMTRRLIHYE